MGDTRIWVNLFKEVQKFGTLVKTGYVLQSTLAAVRSHAFSPLFNLEKKK